MNNLLYFRKRHTSMTTAQAHDYVSAKHRTDFDHKSWWKSVAIFWACIFAFGLVMAGVRYATACGDLGETDQTINQIRADGI